MKIVNSDLFVYCQKGNNSIQLKIDDKIGDMLCHLCSLLSIH